MEFLVKRCVRNQVIFAISGLVLAAALLWTFVTILQPEPAPMPTQHAVTGVIKAPRQQKSVELRKQAITHYLAAKYKQQKDVVRKYVNLAWRESEKRPEVQPELILSIMTKESSLKPKAESGYGAQGLMQVVRRHHPEKVKEKESLFDPKVNVRVGAQILQEYIKEKGELAPALVKYSGNASGYAEYVIRERDVLLGI